jgi:glutathione S-transferase
LQSVPAGAKSAAMILYHFSTSPFARRVRLALAYKGLSAELRDARANPAYLAEVQALSPVHTVPVLVDGERVLTDSMAICQHLDRKVPEPSLFAHADFEIVSMVDTAIGILVDLGMRYHALHDHPEFKAVRDEYVGRSQRVFDRLATLMPAREDRWGFTEMAVYTMVAWLEGLPARGAVFAPAKQVAELGFRVPEALSQWAARHRQRPDVIALG